MYDFEISFTDPESQELSRWFTDKESFFHMMELVEEELGSPAYVMENYF